MAETTDQESAEAGAAPDAAWGLCPDTRLALLAIVFCLLAMACVHIQTARPNSDFSNDGPYHVAMADLFSQAAVGRTFPWTQLSMWRECFYDKELGFHLFLLVVRRWGGLFGYRGDTPPFVLETFVLVSLWLLAFCWALRRLGVRQSHIFIPVAALFCPFFTDRLNLVRPHVLSIGFLVVTAAVVCTTEGRRRLAALFCLGFMLSYVHSNPHFILLPTGCYALVMLREDRWCAFLPCCAAIGGAVAGLTLHPQFPNTFLVWKVQCIDVPLHAMSRDIALSYPSELSAPAMDMVLSNAAMLVFPVGVTAMLFLRRERPDRRLLFMLCLSTLTCLGFFRTKRLIEYALPFSVMAGALAYNRWCAHRSARFHGSVFAAVMAVALLLLPLQRKQFTPGHIAMPTEFAEWARKRIPPGTYIANLFWTEFPRLFFVAPEYRYSYGLDPMFGYVADPERISRLEKIVHGGDPFPAPQEMRALLGSGLAFVGIREYTTARRMAEAGYAIAYQGVDGWCFNLDAPAVDHGL